MAHIDYLKQYLMNNRHRWLVTGAAGFIGSNILEELLLLDQEVIGLDNLSTGHHANLADVQKLVGEERWRRFTFIEGDIRDESVYRKACEGVEYVLHQAALGSVPRSIKDPVTTNDVNIGGFMHMLVAARDAGVRRLVFASSSSVYGDSPELPKREERIGRPLSPYAVSKYVNEVYADVFAKTYGMELIGLRYFNVFGKRQDPNGAYAAVIPRWIGLLLQHMSPTINGDGEHSRDFCYIRNAVQANLLAAITENPDAANKVYNIACGQRTNLNQLFELIRDALAQAGIDMEDITPQYGPPREGDVKHSLADITQAVSFLQYEPLYFVQEGMRETISWFLEDRAVDTVAVRSNTRQI